VVERFLRYLGYRVVHVSNVTDISIDDRILRRIAETGESFQQLVGRHTRDYFEDRRQLGIAEAHAHPLATQHIQEMIELVQRLIDRGYAYIAEDGVYFRISSFPEYGKLSGVRPEAVKVGASGRISKDEYGKESVGDFVLWKRAKPGEPFWYSPWGPGRPGWHIECSAMAMKYLGESFDIQGGGEDNLFPHHENTLAQSEAATGKPFVRYWMHVKHLLLRGEKMSKSLGNFLTSREACERYGAATVRLFLLSTHYRKPLDFDEDNLAAATKKLRKLQQAITLLSSLSQDSPSHQPSESALAKALAEAEHGFLAAMSDDFNIALALSQLLRLASLVLRHLNQYKAIGVQLATKILDFLERAGTVLFGDLYRREVAKPPDKIVSQLVSLLLEERERYRRSKEYGRADAIRAALKKMGIEVTDTSTGPVWWYTPSSPTALEGKKTVNCLSD